MNQLLEGVEYLVVLEILLEIGSDWYFKKVILSIFPVKKKFYNGNIL